MDNLANLVAKDVMVSPVVSTSPDDKLRDLEARFIDEQISGMPVVDQDKLIGFISKTDLVRLDAVQVSLEGYIQQRMPWIGTEQAMEADDGPRKFDLVRQLTVREAMRSNVVTCTPLTPLPELAREMVRHQIHRIVIVDGDAPVGIVSALDLAGLLTHLDATE